VSKYPNQSTALTDIFTRTFFTAEVFEEINGFLSKAVYAERGIAKEIS
jgi:hypothetical protein